MISIRLFIASLVPGLLTLAAAPTESSTQKEPARLRREQSYFGLHFDFHARPIDRGIGRHSTREMIERVLDAAKPDFVQIDCKGHFGISSYPTHVGYPAPEIVGDPLRLWRTVTAERGVALYVHFSGVADDEAIRRNPEWAAIDASGKPSTRSTSLFSRYTDEIMLPQLKEIATEYRVDGAWIDGDCWAVQFDYHAAAQDAFRRQTGQPEIPRLIGPAPVARESAAWQVWTGFHRESFRRHLRRYVSELKAAVPRLQVASNWAFSDHMPEPVTAPVDFLSGDYAAQNSVNWARFTARTLEGQGKPWDLMAWGFAQVKTRGPDGTVTGRAPGYFLKSVPQLQQEAAIVLARGGAFQGYFPQQEDGSVYDTHIPVMRALAEFCRARQALCHRAKPVPQIALLFSTASHYLESPTAFGTPVTPTAVAVRGALQSLLDSQYSVEVVSEHHLRGRMGQWPVIVIPETVYLEPEFVAEIKDYVRSGGQLVAIGPKAAEHFREDIGFTLSAKPPGEFTAHLERESQTAVMLTDWEIVELPGTAQATGRLYRHGNRRTNPDISRGSYSPAGSISPLGRGRIAATYVNLGERYLNGRTVIARDYLRDLIQAVFPKPMVEVMGSRHVDVSVMESGGRLKVNLVNTSGPHENEAVYTFDEIPRIGPLSMKIRTDKRVERISLQPSARVLDFVYDDHSVVLQVPDLGIHEVVVVEFLAAVK